jgi:hypothetical protein
MTEVNNTEEPTVSERIEALAEFLEIEVEEGEELDFYVTEDDYTDNAFEAEGGTYLVLTDSEADEKAQEYVSESLWAFTPSFLASETELPEEVFTALQDKAEDANDTFLTLVEKCCDGGIEAFTQTAISYDGRGHFLAQYDSEESQVGKFYIYRTN